MENERERESGESGMMLQLITMVVLLITLLPNQKYQGHQF